MHFFIATTRCQCLSILFGHDTSDFSRFIVWGTWFWVSLLGTALWITKKGHVRLLVYPAEFDGTEKAKNAFGYLCRSTLVTGRQKVFITCVIYTA